MAGLSETEIQMIPVDRVRVLNPRERNAQKFKPIVESIERAGLKRPITVTQRADGSYDLVCGQGRLEAFRMLGQRRIPAIITTASEEDCYLMSLVENLARRRHNPLDLMRAIGDLDERGYTPSEIAKKIGVTSEYVRDLLQLLRNGEERLVAAVEREQLPITVAIEIAGTPDTEIQQALTDAYERNELRGHRLRDARRLVEQRRRRGKALGKSVSPPKGRKLTAQAMVRAFTQETERQRAMLKRHNLTERRLVFIVSALKQLFADENFRTLLRAEGLESVPKQLADMMQDGGRIT